MDEEVSASGRGGARSRSRACRTPAAGALALALAAAACGEASSADTPRAGTAPAAILVFAASSLAAPFERLAREFEAAHPHVTVSLSTAGTPQLVLQVREGAPAHVFASADVPYMEKLVATGHVAGAAATFARNRLAIAVAAGNPHRIASLADLARAELRVVLCGPAVPAGRYARDALAKAGVVVTPVSDEPHVRAALGKVELGEADAAIVYATDTAAAGARVDAIAIPPEHDVVASCPIALLARARDDGAARAFVAHVLSPAGRRVLASFGFGAP